MDAGKKFCTPKITEIFMYKKTFRNSAFNYSIPVVSYRPVSYKDGQVDGLIDRHIDRRTDVEIDRYTDRQTDTYIDGQLNLQVIYRWIERQIDR